MGLSTRIRINSKRSISPKWSNAQFNSPLTDISLPFQKIRKLYDNCTMSFWPIETPRGLENEKIENKHLTIQPLSNYVSIMMPQEKISSIYILLTLNQTCQSKALDIFCFHKVKQEMIGAKVWVNHWLHLLHSSVSMQNLVTTQIQKHLQCPNCLEDFQKTQLCRTVIRNKLIC